DTYSLSLHDALPISGEKYNPLFIYGDVGLGKTHLATAIGHHLWSSSSTPRKVLFMPAEAFMNELINSIRRERMGEFKERFRTVRSEEHTSELQSQSK